MGGTVSDDSKLEVVTAVPDRAMVIFAHPDDAEIGSGGVGAKWVAPGAGVPSLPAPTAAAGRRGGQRGAAEFMGVRHVVMLGYPDGGLEDTRDFLGDVVRAIRRHRP